MPKFSEASKQKLSTCHPDLQTLFNEVIKYFDCTVICGQRGKEDQNKAFREGKSKLQWPNSNHNLTPSLAVDVLPYPIDFNDRIRIVYFAGFVLGLAEQLYIEGKIKSKIRWGGDWNHNHLMSDEKFVDMPHFEIEK